MSLFVEITQLEQTNKERLDPVNELLRFYPQAMMIARKPKVLAFYEDTKLFNLRLHIPLMQSIGVPNITGNCDGGNAIKGILNDMISRIHQLQSSILRLASMQGLTNLIECDSYLYQYYVFETDLTPRMLCPKIYKSSIQECKVWALKNCKHISPEERIWLQSKPRSRRNPDSFFCHAGLLGIPRFIYTATGHSCESNHVSGLKIALNDILDGMKDMTDAINLVYGKTVYLVKVTDQMNTRLNLLAEKVRFVDKTLLLWKTTFHEYSKKVSCHYNINMQFLINLSAEAYHIFSLLIRFIEVEDLIREVYHILNLKIFGYAALPPFLTKQISQQLITDTAMKYTENGLQSGLSLLVHPMVDFNYNQERLMINILLTIPQILNEQSICTVEYLEPVVYNISNYCHTGPIEHDNLALITCKESRSIITVEALSKCFKDQLNFLCPLQVLRQVKQIDWLGLPWSPHTKISFQRLHQNTSDCSDLHPLIHIGGRYFLATTEQPVTFKNQTGEFKKTLSPLVIYNFPCSVRIPEAGIDECPSRLELHVPIFTQDNFQYYHWSDHTDSTILDLHYTSLNIPPPLKFNKTTLDALDKAYKLVNARIKRQLLKIRKDISQIRETSILTITAILVYIALPLSVINTIILICMACCYCKRANNMPYIPTPVNHESARTSIPKTERIELKTLLQQSAQQQQGENPKEKSG